MKYGIGNNFKQKTAAKLHEMTKQGNIKSRKPKMLGNTGRILA
jgi:hypothetical protein